MLRRVMIGMGVAVAIVAAFIGLANLWVVARPYVTAEKVYVGMVDTAFIMKAKEEIRTGEAYHDAEAFSRENVYDDSVASVSYISKRVQFLHPGLVRVCVAIIDTTRQLKYSITEVSPEPVPGYDGYLLTAGGEGKSTRIPIRRTCKWYRVLAKK